MSLKAKSLEKIGQPDSERSHAGTISSHAKSRLQTEDNLNKDLGSLGNLALQRLFQSGAIQAKLQIGQPGDPFEQEADRVADQVIRMSETSVKWGQGDGRDPSEERVTSDPQALIASLRDGGHPLQPSVLAFFEQRFGHDLSRVRIHSDERATPQQLWGLGPLPLGSISWSAEERTSPRHGKDGG